MTVLAASHPLSSATLNQDESLLLDPVVGGVLQLNNSIHVDVMGRAQGFVHSPPLLNVPHHAMERPLLSHIAESDML